VKRLRVLQIVASSRGGGAEVVRCLVKGLDPREFASEVVMPDDGGHIGPADFEALGAHLEQLALEAGFSVGTWLRLRNFINRGHFDIVHVHGARAALWGRLAVLGSSRPRVVFGVHGLSIVHYSGLKRQGLVSLERALRAVTDRTLCDSLAEREEVLKWHLAAPERTQVVWNGIDVDRLISRRLSRGAARAQLGLDAEASVLITVCRLNKPRDFKTLLAGVAELVRAQPNLRLLIVGDGPQRPQVEALVAQHCLETHVRLLGLVPHVGDCLAAADIALLITAGWEGLPLSALEAMSLGLPLIISDVGGNREAVIDGETGLVIPPGDVAAFVRAGQLLLAQPGRASQMGQAGARRAQTHFTLSNMAAKIAEIYRAMAGERTPPPRASALNG
jgi:glycosyltransferase involved in cell wall biosynthesis